MKFIPGINILYLVTTLLLLALLHPRAEGLKLSQQCRFRGYKPGGVLPNIKKISSVPPEKFETSALDNVLGYFNQGGTVSAATLSAIDAAGVALKGSAQVTAVLGIMAVAVGFASNTPSPQDVLDRAYSSVKLLTEEVNERVNQMQDYADKGDLEVEQKIMRKDYKELFDKWYNCAKLRPGRDPGECEERAEEDLTSARLQFQAANDIFDEKVRGKQVYDPNFSYRYVATWQWMKKYEGKGYFTAPTYQQVKRLEIGLIPFRDYATLHLIVLETLANTYKAQGAKGCPSYKFYLNKLVEKSDYYVRYVKWAYEWIYIRQYEENMYFGVDRRVGGGPASAKRGGFLGTRECSGSKCTIQCTQMMKDNICTVEDKRRRRKRALLMEEAYKDCDKYMGNLKKKMTDFWTNNVLNVGKSWEKYGENAKQKLSGIKC